MIKNNIVVHLHELDEEKKTMVLQLVGENFSLFLTGKEKSEFTERRIRQVLRETRPDTTDYDFRTGDGFYFSQDRVELKQFDANGKQPKIQQVKPELYDKIVVVAEFQDKALWYLLHTDKISKLAGKKNKEDGKLALNSQHKGNTKEGQISYNKSFIKTAIYITETSKIDYRQDNLGISDEQILEILEFTKNH